MLTQADLKISEAGLVATLKQKDKVMTVRLHSPARARFSVTDATPSMPEENQNKGYQRLVVDIMSAGEPVTIAIQFMPEACDSVDLPITALGDW
jgi:hypothetical protein